MIIANDNDNEVIASPPGQSCDSILPPHVREMLNQCDRAGIGMDVVMSVIRARLRAKGFKETDGAEMVLKAFRNVLERNR